MSFDNKKILADFKTRKDYVINISDPKTNKIVSDLFERQIDQALYNLEQVLIKGGSTKQKIIKLTVYLTDLSNSSKVNDAFSSFFINDFPARSLVEVSALPKNAKIEIEAISIK